MTDPCNSMQQFLRPGEGGTFSGKVGWCNTEESHSTVWVDIVRKVGLLAISLTRYLNRSSSCITVLGLENFSKVINLD